MKVCEGDAARLMLWRRRVNPRSRASWVEKQGVGLHSAVGRDGSACKANCWEVEPTVCEHFSQ
jgi:hypothetical protein